MEFQTEKRKAFEKDYLKVFLRDTSLNAKIKEILSKLQEVHQINITNNKREDLTIYPAMMIGIEELDSKVNYVLAEYFKIRLNQNYKQKEVSKTTSNEGTQINTNAIIERSKEGFITKLKLFWLAYHNHVYGIITIIGVLLSIIFWVKPYTENSNKMEFMEVENAYPDTKDWTIADTLEFTFDGQTIPLFDNNINITKDIADLYIGGINCDLLDIGIKSLDGDKINAVYDTTQQRLKMQLAGDKIIQIKYFGKLFQITQKLTDFNLSGNIEDYYFHNEFYLEEIMKTTMVMKNIKEYK